MAGLRSSTLTRLASLVFDNAVGFLMHLISRPQLFTVPRGRKCDTNNSSLVLTEL